MNILNEFKKNPLITSVLVLGIGYFIYKKIIKKNEDIKDSAKPKPISPVPEKKRGKEAVDYTYGKQDYMNFANGLFKAMDNTGTDEDAIARIMSQMKTYDDVLALINAYGKRKWTKWEIWDISPSLMTLSEALNDELSAEDLEEYVNQPLSPTEYVF
jgi:hypothetical protein